MGLPTRVNFLPIAKQTNGLIKLYNAKVDTVSAQELADEMASTIAAISYMMISAGNSAEAVCALYADIVADSEAQFIHRKELVASGRVQDDGTPGQPN